MKKGILFFLILICVNSAFANDGDYAVSKIAPELLKNANAVLRTETIQFEVISTKEAMEWRHYVITILNENGDKWSGFGEYYDHLQEIVSVNGVLYDANGKEIKKMKEKDMQDISGVDDNNLIDDERIKEHNFYYKVYPYTVEYNEVVRCKNMLFFPFWSPRGNEKISVEHSQISIICPEGYSFRYKAFNYAGEPLTSADKGKTTKTWSANNLPAIELEPFSPYWQEITTYVDFGPGDFDIEGYKGNMESWQNLGKFIYSLKEGRDVLPNNIKLTVHQLTDGITSEKKKVQVLYEYMQKNTRYISIQLGIGGWQPFDATYVATKGYGDCKALVNYMYSLLKEAGIKSCYTTVKAGDDNKFFMPDFPNNQFDHIILCVPLQNDTMWLECTNQTVPAGYLGDFTDDRYVLAVDEAGGHLIRTPKYGMKDNQEVRRIKASLDADGTLQVKASTRYSCMLQDNVHGLINELSKDKVKEVLHNKFDFATYDINSFQYHETKSALPFIDEFLDITVSNYANITGKRLFITPNIMTRSGRKLSTEERKYDIVLKDEYREVDSVEIEIPKGYASESVPQPATIESKFGKYSNSVKVEGNKIYYYRTMEQYSGKFAAADYSSMVSFYDAVYKADRSKLVLVKNESTDQKAF